MKVTELTGQRMPINRQYAVDSIPLSILRGLYANAWNIITNVKKIRTHTSLGLAEAVCLAKEIRNRKYHGLKLLERPRWRALE